MRFIRTTRRSQLLAGLPLALAIMVSACGDSGGGSKSQTVGVCPQPRDDNGAVEAAIRTLAYAVTTCHEEPNAGVSTVSQVLRIQRGDQPPVIIPTNPTVNVSVGLCALFAEFHDGTNSVFGSELQRLAVTPDGSGVVFEITFAFSLFAQLGTPDPLTRDQEGIFYVRADGTGLRRLAPPSRAPSQVLDLAALSSSYDIPFFGFSPDGRFVTYNDQGPGPDCDDAPQIVLLDIVSGGPAKVLTHLPCGPSDPTSTIPATTAPSFLDGNTIIFLTRSLSTDGVARLFTVTTDGTLSMLPPLAATGNGIVPTFSITRPITSLNLQTLDVPGTAVNPIPGYDLGILEVFSVSDDHILQLTNFRRNDTGSFNATTDGHRVFFTASADPFGCNPSNNCQFFSIDPLGGDLRQLTQLGDPDEPSAVGCGEIQLPLEQPFTQGCYSRSGPVIDPETHTLIFNSTCDPLGTNPNGEQFFAMHLDGSGLRQLTATRGVTVAHDADGNVESIDAELPGPAAYSAPIGGLY